MDKSYRRKPKNSRRPPVWRNVQEVCTLQDAILDTYLAFREYDPGYTQSTIAKWRKIFNRSASIHVNPGKSVTLLMQEHVVRWNVKAQKHFLSDETVMVRTAYITSKDRVAFYFYNINHDEYGRRNKNHVSPTGSYDDYMVGYFIQEFKNDNPFKEWRKVAETEFGRSIAIESVYPGMTHFGRDGFELLGHNAMRATTASEACDLIFGKSRHRKDLVRAVGKKMIENNLRNRAHIIAWVELFKKSVPVDWLVEALNSPYSEMRMSEEYEILRIPAIHRKEFRNLLDQLKPNERRNILLHNHGTRQGWYFHDGIIVFINLRTNFNTGIPVNRDNIKSMQGLHDLLVNEHNRLQNEQRRRFQIEAYKPEKMKISDEDLNEYAQILELDERIDIRFARDYDTLVDWSTFMNNCISSYFTSSALLGGVYRDGVLYANLEIRVQRIRNLHSSTDEYYWNLELYQLLGKHNNKLMLGDKLWIESILEEYGVRLSANRWA